MMDDDCHILVVDDEPDVWNTLAEVLGEERYEVTAYVNAR
jgi:CheY-like chemotaxis protein